MGNSNSNVNPGIVSLVDGISNSQMKSMLFSPVPIPLYNRNVETYQANQSYIDFCVVTGLYQDKLYELSKDYTDAFIEYVMPNMTISEVSIVFNGKCEINSPYHNIFTKMIPKKDIDAFPNYEWEDGDVIWNVSNFNPEDYIFDYDEIYKIYKLVGKKALRRNIKINYIYASGCLKSDKEYGITMVSGGNAVRYKLPGRPIKWIIRTLTVGKDGKVIKMKFK